MVGTTQRHDVRARNQQVRDELFRKFQSRLDGADGARGRHGKIVAEMQVVDGRFELVRITEEETIKPS